MGCTGAIAMDSVVREGGRTAGEGLECEGTDYFEGGLVGTADGGCIDEVVLVEGSGVADGSGGIVYVVVIEMGITIYE